MTQLQVIPKQGFLPDIGRWLWGMEEARQRTLKTIKEIDQPVLDWEGPDGKENAIGTLLHHIAAVEMGWLFIDIQGHKEIPDEVKKLLPFDWTEDDGVRLKRVLGVSLDDHVQRLNQTRAIFIREMGKITLDDFHRLRDEPWGDKYEVTPEWVIFHLIEHEAGHAFQIGALKARADRWFTSSKESQR